MQSMQWVASRRPLFHRVPVRLHLDDPRHVIKFWFFLFEIKRFVVIGLMLLQQSIPWRENGNQPHGRCRGAARYSEDTL